MQYTLITWASSGIGKACAFWFAVNGNNLILAARNKEKLEAIQSEILNTHDISVICKVLDVTDTNGVTAFFQSLESDNIEINCCINNAWLALWEDEFTCVDWNDIQTMIDTNIKWFTQIAHGVIPFLKKTAWHLFNLSSVAWVECYDWWHVYGASKAYVKFLSKSLRLEVFGTWIRITDIAPWSVNTEWFSSTRFKWNQDKVNAVYAWYEPLHAEDIINTILFCFNSPAHVNIEYLAIMPTAQAAARKIFREG
jgi:3-hydroxy acid dehydrogenase / malonic semialdehyde reductase